MVVATPAAVDDRVAQTLNDLASRLTRALAGAGLTDPVVRVRPTDRLDRHPVSGKFRRFVPLSP